MFHIVSAQLNSTISGFSPTHYYVKIMYMDIYMYVYTRHRYFFRLAFFLQKQRSTFCIITCMVLTGGVVKVKFVILCACLTDVHVVIISTPVNSYGPLVILVQGPKALEVTLLVRALNSLKICIPSFN